jgi:hypothetical protein
MERCMQRRWKSFYAFCCRAFSGDPEFDDFKNPADFADGYDYGPPRGVGYGSAEDGGYSAAVAAGPRYPQTGSDVKFMDDTQVRGGRYNLDSSLDGKKTDTFV